MNDTSGKKTSKKNQVTIEFITITALGLVISTVFCGYILSELNKDSSQEKYDSLKNIASEIQSEIKMASESMDGYNRFFSLPKKVLSENYTIEEYNSTWINIRTGKESLTFNVNEFRGNIGINNHISKNNGIITITGN